MSDLEKTHEVQSEKIKASETDVIDDANKLANVDTVHQDEAMRVLAAYNGEEAWTEKEEKQVRRKIDLRLMPVLCITYGLQYYDKAMLSQAALFGLRTDLRLTTGNRYSFSAAIFYLGFIVGAYPAMMLAQRFPIERVASAIVVVWGVCLILTVACHNYQALYAQRFFLGLLESGISPMFMMIVGSFYKKSEQAFRMGIWYSCTGYVSIFSPLINYAFGQAKGPLSPWKYMYLFAGAITILWGVALLWVLPPDPVRAKGFNERQRYISVARLRTNNSGVRNTHLKTEQIWELLLDGRFWLMFSVAFLSMIANGPISTFVPIIINSFGFSTLHSLLLVMPAGAFAGTLQLVVPWLCYKYSNLRSLLIFACQLGTTLAALLLWLLPRQQTGALLFACYILPSVGGGYAVLMGLQLANTAGYTKRSVASSGIYIGYCLGNVVGPLVFKPEDAPRYVPGFIVVTVTAIIAGLLALVYRVYCMWENKRRDKAGILEGFEHAYEDDLTDTKTHQSGNVQSSFVSIAIPRKSNATFKECKVRPSRREKRRKSNREGNPTRAESQSQHISNGVEALLAADSTLQALTDAAKEQEADAIDPHLSHDQTSPNPIGNTTPTQVGDVDTGFLQVYGLENQFDAENQALVAQLEHRYSSDLYPDLENIFKETYFSYCYPWCPVLDRNTLSSEIARSPLLANALALASSHIQPPMLPHDGPDAYYKRARKIFYEDEEADTLTTLKSLCLFYWWAPQSPSRVHRHSSWWWTSVVIRHAQQMNIHREPSTEDANRMQLDLSLRRRIWWTAFARERLTALCQSKPAIIDPNDCSMSEPTLADFPNDSESQRQGEIFIYWVRLCAIIGRIAKVLLQSNKAPLPEELREELVIWVHSLPPRLRLQVDSARTQHFDRDVHQLHLFYLTTIIIIHLKRSDGQLPQALPPAILAASCTARLLRDFLARGSSRFLMAITCWHVGTAFIALLQACRIQHLSQSANEDLDVLEIAVKELQKMWASANVVAQGFDRLRKPGQGTCNGVSHSLPTTNTGIGNHNTNPLILNSLSNHANLADDDSFDWMRFFPFISKSTNGIAESLISGKEQGTATRGFPSPNNELFYDTLLAQYQDLFDPLTDYTFAFPEVSFNPN
ncbi:major facilitator superfamily domain-containing protein [Dendryphion nanum]|uniref:Major facilitator superfamily domain-containing protein n=1 Tax=Dendryphion nanum TaxID=256645 RepID=A0A9P9IVP3_9PLEO|nr:major facilitator superfamily domain-containing protein [Dendryphion nanum]